MSISVPADPATVGGNLYPKYTARNPIARLLVDRFLAHLLDLARRSGARQVHEVGCGEGFLSTMLAERGFVVRGTDIAPAAIATARRRAADLALPASYDVADLHDLAPDVSSAELVVCCEVLEHLSDPVDAMRLLARPI